MKHRIYHWLRNNKKSTLLLSAVLILFVIPYAVHANILVDLAGEALFKIIATVGAFAVSILGFLLNQVQKVFELILNENINFTSHLEVIKVGWKLSRDVANMFFVFVIFAIAITTILRLEGGFLAKDALVRLIVMAILINFSLTMGGLVIDASNALGIQFYNAIRGKSGGISDVMMARTGLQAAFKVETINQEPPAGSTAPSTSRGIQTPSSTALRWAILAWGNAMLIGVLLFIFVLATILFFIRFVALMFLLMLAPLAFLSYILPATTQHWTRWWKELTQHAMFFPAFMFLLYFALAFSGNIQKAAQEAGPGGNLIDSPSLILSYFFTVAVLLTSITLGKSMGVYSADTALAWARTGRKWATGSVGYLAGKGAGLAIQNSGALESERVRNIQDRLTRGGTISRFAARTMDATKSRLANVGGYQKGGERDADFLQKSARSNWQGGYSKLSSAGKAAFLNKLNAKDRADFLENLDPAERAYADRIVRGRLAPSVDADLQASKIQRASSKNEQMALFAKSSPDAQEQYLRSLDQNERARFINDLNISPDAAERNAGQSSEDILKSRFSSIDRTAHEVAEFDLLTEDQKIAKFGLGADGRPLMDERVTAMILKNKSAEDRKKIFDKINKTHGEGAAIAARKALKNYSTTEEWRAQEIAEFRALPLEQQKTELQSMLADIPGENEADKNLKRRKAEDIIKKMGPKDQAQLMHLLGDTAVGVKMDGFMKTALGGRDYAKYIGERSELWSNEEINDRFESFDELSKEEVLRKYKVGPELSTFTGQLSEENRISAEAIIESTFATGEQAKYYSAQKLNLLPFDKVIDAFLSSETNDLIREQMLRDMTAERRAGFLQDLSKRNPTDYAVAERALKRFPQDEQDNYLFERFKFEGDKDRRTALLVGANDRVRTKILAGGFGSDTARESFLNTKLAEYDKLDEKGKQAYLEKHLAGFPSGGAISNSMNDLQGKSRTILTSSAFTDAQRKEYTKHQLLAQIDGWQSERRLGTEFYGNAMSVQKRSDLLRNADTDGRKDFFNLAAQDTTGTSMEKLHQAVQGLDRSEREKLLRDAIPATSPKTFHKYLDFLEKETKKTGADVTQLHQIQSLAFKLATPEQQAASWEEAFKQYKESGTTESGRNADPLAMHAALVKKFEDESGEGSKQVENYYAGFVKQLQHNPKTSPENIAEMYPFLDQSVRTAFVKNPKLGGQDVVKSTYNAAPEVVRIQIKKDIEEAGLTNKFKNIDRSSTPKNPPNNPPTKSATQTQSEQFNQVAAVAQKAQSQVNIREGAPTTTHTTSSSPRPTQTAQASAPASGGGSAKPPPNAAALGKARAASGGANGTYTFSKAAERVISQAPQQAAQNYGLLSAKDKKEIMMHSPSTMVALRDHATNPAIQMQVVNDLQTSAPAARFRSAGGSAGKISALQRMSNEEKQVVFEAAASAGDPRELKQLRAAIESLPAEEQKAFHENITKNASTASVTAYAKQIKEDTVSATENNLSGKVDILTREGSIIENIITTRVAAAPTPTTATVPPAVQAPTPQNTPTIIPVNPASTQNAAPSVSPVEPSTTYQVGSTSVPVPRGSSTTAQPTAATGAPQTTRQAPQAVTEMPPNNTTPASKPATPSAVAPSIRIAGIAGGEAPAPASAPQPSAPATETKEEIQDKIAAALGSKEVALERENAAPQTASQQKPINPVEEKVAEEHEAGVSISFFKATPSQILLGQSSVLEWVVGKATSITIDHGIGRQGRSGRTYISPTVTTRFTLTATGTNGEIKTATVMVTVKVPPPSSQPKNNPTSATPQISVPIPPPPKLPAQKKPQETTNA